MRIWAITGAEYFLISKLYDFFVYMLSLLLDFFVLSLLLE